MRIDVSMMDWWKGKKGIPADCMVARAVKRATGLTDVTVGYSLIKLGSVAVPVENVDFRVRAFDNGDFVFPFSFELTLPIEVSNEVGALVCQ